MSTASMFLGGPITMTYRSTLPGPHPDPRPRGGGRQAQALPLVGEDRVRVDAPSSGTDRLRIERRGARGWQAWRLAIAHRLGVLGRVEDREELGLVVDHLLAAQPGQVVEAGQLDRLDRAGLLAHAAVDAPQLVDDEALAILLAVGPGLGGGCADDVDAVRRAGRGAEHARDALDPPLLVLVQPVHPAIIRARDVLLLGILHRDRRVGEDDPG